MSAPKNKPDPNAKDDLNFPFCMKLGPQDGFLTVYHMRYGSRKMKARGDVESMVPPKHWAKKNPEKVWKPVLRVRRGISTRQEQAEVLCHEVMHTLLWQSDEEHIVLIGEKIAEALAKSGLLRKDEPTDDNASDGDIQCPPTDS